MEPGEPTALALTDIDKGTWYSFPSVLLCLRSCPRALAQRPVRGQNCPVPRHLTVGHDEPQVELATLSFLCLVGFAEDGRLLGMVFFTCT